MKNRYAHILIFLLITCQALFAFEISGIVVDEENGNTITDVSIKVNDTTIETKDGEFQFTTEQEGMIRITASSPGYKSKTETIFLNSESNQFQFVSIVLSKGKDKKKETTELNREKVAGLPWKIQCSIIDTRYGLAIQFPGWAEVTYNDSTFRIYKDEFLLTTNEKGSHSLHIKIPGFHSISEIFTCSDESKELSLMLETTDTLSTVKRREMVITEKRGTIHERTVPGKKTFSRKELSETAGTFDDPIRSIETLPSISTSSDASARLSVRGGDVLESRYFVDGIPLLQPFHFGGAISIFNEQAIQGLNFYNSGYPARLHNAQSSIIDVTSRKAFLEDSTSQFIHISSLKYNFYRTQKAKEDNKGVTVSATGTWLPLLFKPINRFIQKKMADSYNPYYRALINPVEYHTLTAGYGKEVNSKWNYNINNIFNFDKFSYIEIDSPAVVEYTYPDGSKLQKSFENSYDEEDKFETNPPKHGFIDYRVVDRKLVADTAFHYKQYYNVLYGTATYTANSENSLNLSAAWQKRWFDIKFPRNYMFEEDNKTPYKYEANTDILSLGAVWFNNSHKKHLFNFGTQLDMNFFDYDVYTMRPWHEVITRGNTNFGDMLGPFANDSGKTFGYDTSYIEDFNELRQRSFVKYKDRKQNFQGACFFEDEINFNDEQQLSLGLRIEGSTLDKELTFSPRIHYKQQLSSKNEFSVSTGLYTQNNYEPDVIALTERLKPEKCVHLGFGYSHLFKEWLKVDTDIYGKYYYDLSVELMNLDSEINMDNIEELDSGFTAMSYYKNDGVGYALGGELFVKYDPADFLFGWFSLSYGHSYRQRQKGWDWHAMPLERPFQFSWSHFYKLPRKYTISCTYKLKSGLPYTGVDFDKESELLTIGSYNKKRYDFYKRLDIRLSRAFHKKNRKTEIYLDYINVFNRPNVFLLDSKEKTIESTALNVPFSAFTWGINMEF